MPPTCFNPRPRTGGDTVGLADGCVRTWKVSIRAPARGATSPVRGVPTVGIKCFNPRPRTGGDLSTAEVIVSLLED